MKLLESFRSVVIARMGELRMSPEELARQSDVAPEHMRLFLAGDIGISFDIAESMADALRASAISLEMVFPA